MELEFIHKRLAGKTAIITGGASGIGAAAARLFAAEGASISVADINTERGEAVVQELRKNGASAIFVRTDISSRDDIITLLARTEETFGGIDVILANAGYQGPLATAVDYSPKDWKRVVDIDLHGAYYLCKYGIPYLQKRGGGSIVITASLSAYDAGGTVPAYASAKAALCGMTQSLAYDFGKEHIRVNSICPASVHTNLLDGIMSDLHLSPEEEAAYSARRLLQYPMGRLGQPEDIANLMLFLAGEESSYITGKNLIIDGGYWAGVPKY